MKSADLCRPPATTEDWRSFSECVSCGQMTLGAHEIIYRRLNEVGMPTGIDYFGSERVCWHCHLTLTWAIEDSRYVEMM